MYENLIIFVVFLIIDVILSIKRVPLFAFIVGVMQFFICVFIFLPDSTFNIYLTTVFGVFAGITMLINGLEMGK